MTVKIVGVVMSILFVIFSLYGAVDVGSKLFN